MMKVNTHQNKNILKKKTHRKKIEVVNMEIEPNSMKKVEKIK